MKLLIKAGSTSRRVMFAVRDSASTTGGMKTGLTSSSFTISYAREDDGNAGDTAVSLSAGTRGTWSSGGVSEKDSSLDKGSYELGIPNAALASGAKWVTISIQDAGANSIVIAKIEIQLVSFDPDDAVRMALTALPNSAANAAGGLSVIGTGANNFKSDASANVTVGGYATGQAPLQPATAGRTLVVDAAGLADANMVKAGPTGAGTAQTALDIGGTWTAARAAHLDADVSSRMATYSQPAGFLAATFPATVASPTLVWQESLPGAYTGTQAGKTIGTNIDAAVSSRLAASAYTVPPTTAQITTAVWQDTTAGDFTTAGSPGFLMMKLTFDGHSPPNVVATLAANDTTATTVAGFSANGVTLATGAISDATFTVPAETSTPPTGTVGKLHWIAARLGLRRVWDDVVGKVLTVFKSNGTSPQTVNNYTKLDDGTRDSTAALPALVTSADYSLLLDGNGRSTDPNAVIISQSYAEAAAYGGFVEGGAHTVVRFDGNGATVAIGFYGDGCTIWAPTISGNQSTGLIVKVDGQVVTPSYTAVNHVGPTVISAAGSLARGAHLLELIWTNAAQVFVERLANGGSNPTVRCFDAGGNAKFIPPPNYGPVAFLREVTYVRANGGLEPVTFFGWNGLIDTYQGGGSPTPHTNRGGAASPIQGRFVVPPGKTGKLYLFGYAGYAQSSRDGGETFGTKINVNTTIANCCALTKVEDGFAAGEHEFVVINDTVNGEGVAGNFSVIAVMLVDAAWVTDPYPKQPQGMAYTDSQWLAWAVSAADSTPRFMAQYGGYSMAVRSIGGSGYVDAGQYDTANITNFQGPALDFVLVALGGNDNISGGTTVFAAAVAATLAYLVAGFTKPIIVQSIQPTGSQDDATVAAKNAILQAAVTVQNNAGFGNVIFLDMGRSAYTYKTMTVDQTHQNRGGASVLAANLLSLMGNARSVVPSTAAQLVSAAHGIGSYVAGGSVASVTAPVTLTGAYDAAKTAASAAQATTITDLLQASPVVDTSVTPWQVVLLKHGTGGLGTGGVELLRKTLKDVGGAGLTSTNTVVGQAIG